MCSSLLGGQDYFPNEGIALKEAPLWLGLGPPGTAVGLQRALDV